MAKMGFAMTADRAQNTLIATTAQTVKIADPVMYKATPRVTIHATSAAPLSDVKAHEGHIVQWFAFQDFKAGWILHPSHQRGTVAVGRIVSKQAALFVQLFLLS